MCKHIEVGGEVMLIDAIDYQLFKGLSLFRTGHGYVQSYTGPYNCEYVHRVIMNAGPNDIVDHKNGNGMDNRRANLRLVTKSENSQNSTKLRPYNRSGHKNVGWYTAYSKWRVRLMVMYKEVHIGYFDELSEAVAAAEQARIKYFACSRENTMEAV